MQTKIVLDGRSLTLDAVRAVARGEAQVELSPSSVERLKESRKLVFELSDRGIPIYGCNRGVGWNKDKKVTKVQNLKHIYHIVEKQMRQEQIIK